ncbi:glycosyltransferase family 4 protein [Chloroflexota bacterium]
MALRIIVCNSQVPFVRGGAEMETGAMVDCMRRRGHEVEIVQLPFRWYPKSEILKGYLAWRLLNLEESEGRRIDRVYTRKFPSFAVRHSYKVTWLIQQMRQAYDLFGSEHTHFDSSEADSKLRRAIRQMDRQTLSESKHLFAISKNVANRLRQSLGLEAEVLHPPPALTGHFYSSGYGDYVFSISRLNIMKRVDVLVRAMGQVQTPVQCRIAGTGAEMEALQRLARKVGAENRIVFLGFVSDQDAVELLAGALGVYYAPIDEDFGLATVEAMKSKKPVLTTSDSGGVLELIEDGVSGFVTPPGDIAAMAQRIDELYANRALARRMGTTGEQVAAPIEWERTVDRLLEV